MLCALCRSLIVRHADLYYPVRHAVIGSVVVVISRLSAQQVLLVLFI